MPSFRIKSFGGISPNTQRSEGDSSRASIAKDVNLERGSLQPWRYPSQIFDTNKCLCSVEALSCCILGSEKECISYAILGTCLDRVFSTGEVEWPAYAELSDCNSCELQSPDWKRLGVPQPAYAPTILEFDEVDVADNVCCDGNRSQTAEPRAYAYTYVNDLGEEGALSLPSSTVVTEYDGCATVELDIDDIPEGFDISSIRIYRAVPLAKQAAVEGQIQNLTSTSEFLFSQEVAFAEGVTTVVDCGSTLGEAYTSDCSQPPLEDLKGLDVTEYGQLIAYEGKNVWFSRPWQPHVWECAIDLGYCINGLKVVDGSIYVTTNSHPYVIDAKPPTAEDSDCLCCRNVREHPVAMPNISPRSLTKIANGVIWATNSGLARLRGDSLDILTRKELSESDWQAWLPHRIWGITHQGKYFGFNGDRGFIYDFNEGVFGTDYPGADGKFSELSLTPSSGFVNDQDILHLIIDGKVMRWDEASEHLPYTWRSKLNVEGGKVSYAAMKVVYTDFIYSYAPKPSTINLYSNDRLVFTRSVNCSQPFRLPKLRSSLNWEIEIRGVEEIEEIHLASSMTELTLENNT